MPLVCSPSLALAPGPGGCWEVMEGGTGRWPAPLWALPGHGGNTEEGFGTLPLGWIIYLERETKTGRHAKLHSMLRLSQCEKAIVAAEISFSF